MSYAGLDPNRLREVADRLERLSKSFAVGYQGLNNAGRTGVSALIADSVDPVMRSITMEQDQFMLTKDIPTLKASQPVYHYLVKTAVGTPGLDLAGTEAFLPAEDASQYIRVAEVLKVYGIRKSITQMAMLTNEAGGFLADIESENDKNAALKMAEAMERDLYVGGDTFMTTAGDIDSMIASQTGGPVRQVRGIQANIREGDKSIRGIPGDFVGYGNSRTVVFNRNGAVLDRKFLDTVGTAVRDNMGAVAEAHCTTSQLTEFRATFFPYERGDLGASYMIRGADITNDLKAGVSIQTVTGQIDFIPTVFKYTQQRPRMWISSVGVSPNSPATATALSGGATGSPFKAGESYSYRVEALNIAGASAASTSTVQAFTTGDDGKAVDVTITTPSGVFVEKYRVYRTAKESLAVAGKEMYIGQILPSGGGTTVFRDNGKLVPGLDSVLWLPRDKNRAKLAVLGNLMNKMALGLQGLASETVYASYFGLVLDRPRSFALADNVYQDRDNL